MLVLRSIKSLKPSDCSEEQLVVLAKAGDGDAFCELVLRNREKARQAAFAIVSNSAVAEDVILQSIYKAYARLSQLDGHDFGAWFHRIVVNECYQHFRRARPDRHVSLEKQGYLEEELGRCGHLVSDQNDPEKQTGPRELVDLLACEVGRLPLNLRIPLAMALRQQTLMEIGEELGISLSATKSRLLRARRLLRQRIVRHLPTRAGGAIRSRMQS